MTERQEILINTDIWGGEGFHFSMFSLFRGLILLRGRPVPLEMSALTHAELMYDMR